ncbi:hypothetical protein MKW94_016217, partial [Papaver nudicaule]|nr:hypothetical protein [Papaver nudicaule]
GSKDASIMISHVMSRRDVATQMSPDISSRASPKRTCFSPSPPSLLPIIEQQSHHNIEVRDVEVDGRVTVTRWSRNGARAPRKGNEDVKDRKKKSSETQISGWEITETGVSKSKREEAKITAWENLQKAKAETAIRKLE